MAEFNVNKASKGQKELQTTKSYPSFAPSNGVCYSCNKNIYDEIGHGAFKTGISIERATKELITGCPHCNRSYCD